MQRFGLVLGLMATMLAASCKTDDYYEHSGPDEILGPAWAERSPTAQQIYQAYPSEAVRQGVTARVMLLCDVTPARALTCTVEDENVPGWGFGAAALKVSQLFLVKPGIVPPGKRIRVPIRFAVENVN